jgi:hypothetical protein
MRGALNSARYPSRLVLVTCNTTRRCRSEFNREMSNPRIRGDKGTSVRVECRVNVIGATYKSRDLFPPRHNAYEWRKRVIVYFYSAFTRFHRFFHAIRRDRRRNTSRD